MVIFLSTILFFVLGDLLWWRWADGRLRGLRGQLVWRGALAAGMLAMIGFVVPVATLTFLGYKPEVRPLVWPVAAYVWHFLVLPAICGVAIAGALLRTAAGKRRHRPAANRSPGARDEAGPATVSRRQLLGAAVVAVPPLAAAVITGRAEADVGTFRTIRRELYLPGLPRDLDGVTIVHLTDLHIGRFMPADRTGPVADAANALGADFMIFAGDLIDVTAPRVEPGIEFIRRLRPRHGLVMIEGNHDVLSGAERFEKAVQDAGLPLLLNESKTLHVAGRATPVQFLGLAWGELLTGEQIGGHFGAARKILYREPTGEYAAESMRTVSAMRRSDAFPILLAHHPHHFDSAAEAGFPLVLSGHTHGGQLMLTPNIGVGPLRFRYWSGLYRKPGSQLFVSNGIGSWFPWRLNAPPEIVHLTLRRAPDEPRV